MTMLTEFLPSTRSDEVLTIEVDFMTEDPRVRLEINGTDITIDRDVFFTTVYRMLNEVEMIVDSRSDSCPIPE